jgi:hypothetical protein
VQSELAVPPRKGTRHVDTQAFLPPLNQCGHRWVWTALQGLEVVTQIIVVGGAAAEDRASAWERVYGLGNVGGGYDGRARGVKLLLNGQWQTRRAAVLRAGQLIRLVGETGSWGSVGSWGLEVGVGMLWWGTLNVDGLGHSGSGGRALVTLVGGFGLLVAHVFGREPVGRAEGGRGGCQCRSLADALAAQ